MRSRVGNHATELFVSRLLHNIRSCFLVVLAGYGCVLTAFPQDPAKAAETSCKPGLPPHLRSPDIIKKAGIVSGMLEILAERRERFLKTGDLVEIFSTLYFHATRAQFEAALEKDPELAEEMLDLIIRFFDAYEYNRQRFDRGGAKAVEPQWKDFYKTAVATNKQKDVSGLSITFLLFDGVRAHLTDLARTLREAMAQKRVSEEKLRTLFFDMDRLFKGVSHRTVDDIAKMRESMSTLAGLDKALNIGANYVIVLRRDAWEAAVGAGPLKAKDSVPLLGHTNDSREFFSESGNIDCGPGKPTR